MVVLYLDKINRASTNMKNSGYDSTPPPHQPISLQQKKKSKFIVE